jgi:hypothetical protein
MNRIPLLDAPLSVQLMNPSPTLSDRMNSVRPYLMNESDDRRKPNDVSDSL